MLPAACAAIRLSDMNEENIRKYAVLMGELGLTAIEITENNTVLRLERNPAPAGARGGAAVAVPDLAGTAAPAATAAPAEDLLVVRSPMVGVFYASPAENAENFVSVGSRVKKGDTLCIIEAMKLMNEITAEEDGVIAEICATNGQIVEYGSDLFKIKRVS